MATSQDKLDVIAPVVLDRLDELVDAAMPQAPRMLRPALRHLRTWATERAEAALDDLLDTDPDRIDDALARAIRLVGSLRSDGAAPVVVEPLSLDQLAAVEPDIADVIGLDPRELTAGYVPLDVIGVAIVVDGSPAAGPDGSAGPGDPAPGSDLHHGDDR